MNPTTHLTEMQKIHFGSKIICSDGDGGTLVHVGFDPVTRCMTHIGAKHSRLFGKIVYLPFETVVSATRDAVTLNVSRSDLSDASSVRPDGAMAFLDNKSIVQNSSGAKGTLMLVAVQPESGELAYFVVHHMQPGQNTLLRQELVTKLETGLVVVSIPDATLHRLPPYRSDEELYEEVESILSKFTPLHVDLGGLTVRVLDGVLYLDGNISSSLRGDMVQNQVFGIPGLLTIENHLVGDDKLASDLAMALAHDPRTHDLPIGVYPRLGVVRLSGAVHNSQQKAAAEEIVQMFPHVRSVINDLDIAPNVSLLHVMSAAESGDAEDKVPGEYIRHTK